MDPLAYEMASRLPAGCNIADPAAVTLALTGAGFSSKDVGRLLDDVMSIALAEASAGDSAYGATNAILDCAATAALLGGGTSAFFIANILDASISEAMAAPIVGICAALHGAPNFIGAAILAGASLFLMACGAMAYRRQPAPARVKRRRPF